MCVYIYTYICGIPIYVAFLGNVDNQETLRINIFFVSGAKLFEPSETFGEMKIPEEWVATVLIVGSSQ